MNSLDEVGMRYPLSDSCKILSIETSPTMATPRIHEMQARVRLNGGEVVSFRALVGIHMVENPKVLEHWVYNFIAGSCECSDVES